MATHSRNYPTNSLSTSESFAPSTTATDPSGLRWPWLLLVWLVAALIMVSHRPASVLHPMFWAEDGHIWFAQAYQDGPFRQLTHTQGSYLQLVSRMIADIALLVPLHLVPLTMNGLAVLVDVTPVVFLLSQRTRDWGALRYRILIAILYLCLPNSAEWHANATGAQWASCLLMLMIVLARLPQGRAGRAFDLVVLSIAGLTGPFCIFLFPVAVLMAWYRRQPWRWFYAGWVFVFAAVQGIEILSKTGAERSHVPLGASFTLLLRILSARIFAGALLRSFSPLASPGLPWIVPATIVFACTAMMAIALWKGPMELRLFVLFALEFFAAALARPLVVDSGTEWPAILSMADSRYYLLPMLAFMLCVGYLAFRAPSRWLRIVAVGVLCLSPIGAVRGWLDFSYVPQLFDRRTGEFDKVAQRFETGPPGTRVIVPALPFPPWSFTLVKH